MLIKNLKELRSVIKFEKKLYFQSKKQFLKSFLKKEYCVYIWKFQRLLRIQEYFYFKRKKGINSLFWIIISRAKNKLGIKLGIEIPENTIDFGLIIWHSQGIVINGRAKIGKYCQLHGDNCIGNKSISLEAPHIGDNCDIGVGSKIIGDINIGNNVVVGAGAVVINSFNDNCTICGVPAKVIDQRGI